MKKFFTGIRYKLKFVFEKIITEKTKINLLQALPFWVASVIAGLAAVFYAQLFNLAERGSDFILHHNKFLFFFITPVCFIGGWLAVKRFAPNAKGSGIPQVLAAIELSKPKTAHTVKKFLSIRIIIVKIFSSLLMVFGGAVVGREGPTIQIAASVFKKVNDWLPDWWPKIAKKNMIMTGAAAGLAAAFNTPLGGIVFAVEELTKTHINYFKTALFTAIIIAGLTAQTFLGPYLYLGYPKVGDLSSSIFISLAVVAIIAGLAGSGMSKVIIAIFRWKAGFKKTIHHVLYLFITALILVTLMYFINDRMFGSGKLIMTESLFSEKKHMGIDVPLLRILGPILSFTSGAAGGVFAPSLSAGAGIGSWMAGVFQLSDSGTNLIILSGMVAFLTGVTRSPFTSSILVLEMTDRHSVIFHLMLAGMIAGIVSLMVSKHSLYDVLKNQHLREIDHSEKEPGPAPVVIPPVNGNAKNNNDTEE